MFAWTVFTSLSGCVFIWDVFTSLSGCVFMWNVSHPCPGVFFYPVWNLWFFHILCEGVFSLRLMMSNVTDVLDNSATGLVHNRCKLTLLHQSLLERSDEIMSTYQWYLRTWNIAYWSNPIEHWRKPKEISRKRNEIMHETRTKKKTNRLHIVIIIYIF
jgi:hypothetical protein